MIQDLIEIVLAYYQYLASILQTKGVGYTLPWVRTGEGMSFVSLDEAFFAAYIPDVTADARVFFIIVSIIIPLILVFLGLLTLNPPSVVIWYFVLLASVFTLIAGVLAAIISQTAGLNISFLAAQVLMYAGAAGLLACSVGYLCNRITRDKDLEDMEGAVNEDALEARRLLNEKLALRRTRDEREAKLRDRRASTGMSSIVPISGPKHDAEEAEIAELTKKAASVVNLSKKEVFKMQTANMQIAPFVQGMLFGLVVLAVGVILILGAELVGIDAGSLGTFALIIGGTLVLMGVLVIAWTVPSVTRRGREFKWHATQFLQENGMRLLILLMMILYIPIGSSSIVIFNCNTYSCPDGYRLIDQGTAILYNSSNREGRSNGANPYCYPCNPVANPLAPSGLLESACNFNEESRLESAPEIRCETMQRFFWPAAALAFIYILGVPILYLRLISHSTAVLKDDFPVDPTIDDWEVIWETKVTTSSNVVKFLYQPFEYKFRYWRIAQLMQKLGVVITGAYVFRTGSEDVTSSTISLGCALLIHVSMSIALFITEPFIRLYDDGVATALHACLVTCCVIAFCILYGQVPPDEFNIAILAVYLAVPLVLFVVGVHLELRWAREAEEQAEEEQRQRVVEHLEKMDSAQMRAIVEERRAKLAAKKKADNAALNGDTKPVDSDAEEPQEPSSEPLVVVAEEDETQAAAARPMTALNDDGNDDGLQRSGYGAVRSISTARAMARQLGRGREAGGQGHAAPSFLGGSMRGRGGVSPRGGGVPVAPSSSMMFRQSSSTLVGPGVNTESRASFDDGTAELASPRTGSKRFSMRQAPKDKAKRASGGSDDLQASPAAAQVKRKSTSGAAAPPALDSSMSGSFHAGSPAQSAQSEAGSPASLARKGTASGTMGSPRGVHGSMRVGRVGKRGGEEEDPFVAALAASRLASSVKRKDSTKDSSLESSMRRDSNPNPLSGPSNLNSSKRLSNPQRRQSDAMQRSGSIVLGKDEVFGASASIGDAALARELEGSSSGDDLEIDDEEEAKLAEKRAEMMAKVLRAEGARKRRRELIRSGQITEDEAELARATRIAALLGQGEHDQGETGASPQQEDLLNKTMRTGKMNEEALAQAQLDGSEVQNEADAIGLELAEQALEVVEEQILEETKELRDKQGDVDLAMNITAKRTVNRFLMVAGFIGFAALGCSLLGMLAADDDAVVSTRTDRNIEKQIGGYLTWGFFVDSCVCMPVRNDRSRLGLANGRTIEAIDVEVWVCANGRRVERVRSVVNGTGLVSGLPARALCANDFGLGCSLTTNRDETVELSCPANTTAVVPKAVLDLW